MKVSRPELIRALETALGPAEISSEKTAPIAFLPVPNGILLRGQTDEAAGWDFVATEEPSTEAFLVPGWPVLHTLKEIRDDFVELSRQSHELHLMAGGYRAVLWTRPAPQDPPPTASAPSWTVERNVFGSLASLVAYARPKGRSRSVFPGVHLLLGPEGMRIVATDGRRLAMATSKELTLKKERVAILPGRFLLLASRHLDPNEPTEIVLREHAVELLQGSRGISGTVLAGPMPSYKALLPTDAQQTGRLRRARAIEAIRQARLFSARVLVQLDEDKLYLSTPESPEGLAEISVGVEWTGDLFRTQLNTDELLEALENLPGDELSLEVLGERLPVVLRSQDQALATLMPLLW